MCDANDFSKARLFFRLIELRNSYIYIFFFHIEITDVYKAYELHVCVHNFLSLEISFFALFLFHFLLSFLVRFIFHVRFAIQFSLVVEGKIKTYRIPFHRWCLSSICPHSVASSGAKYPSSVTRAKSRSKSQSLIRRVHRRARNAVLMLHLG